MARTRETTRIKRQMADQAREEDHARTAEAIARKEEDELSGIESDPHEATTDIQHTEKAEGR
ncbi:hypothetical protein F441_10824 [Phytophthora nicotianae CJ01A1]|uniref:Uncharacterized protein n=2 Tax=Phytophthora nicotianae TaxID=4792 RepID=W2GN19_PHYNI|nr:hypothetical protein L915_10634 [Phytophthora nicotianae]ETL37834.1 hypothetical protein L916_10524 [Phytophthora nicotianae]ETP14234.1 hypothetical protein F441_10824 [Phytophthora nicotianae CJ01A1]